MSQDFFLMNRAHQLDRLCHSGSFVIPENKVRQKLPQTLRELYERIDRICIAARSSIPSEESKLSEFERADLRQFEKQIVECRFSSDDQVKAPAVALIRAIFSDAPYFSGLKPLPQYTDAFAYELLFPTWLNLLTALMLPSAATGKPKLDSQQQGALFHYLGKLSSAAPSVEGWLTGYATLIASRFDSPECEQLLQRLVDLVSTRAEEVMDSINSIDRDARNARDLQSRLSAYLCVKHSSYQWPATTLHRIAHSRPKIRVLPTPAKAPLERLEVKGDEWQMYFAIALPLSQLVRSDQLLADSYVTLLSRHPERIPELLSLLVHGDRGAILSETSQGCIADLVDKLIERHPTVKLSEVGDFIQTLANRLTGFSDTTLAYFYRRFVEDPLNCEVLLNCCRTNEETRVSLQRQLTDSILTSAAQTSDDKRFINLLCCATVFTNSEEDREARHALQALEGVLSNRSIGNKELEDLARDLRVNAASALTYLARPIMAGVGKSPRVASLYLTLNDVMETFRSNGTVGNFSVVRARYSAITNLDGAG